MGGEGGAGLVATENCDGGVFVGVGTGAGDWGRDGGEEEIKDNRIE